MSQSKSKKTRLEAYLGQGSTLMGDLNGLLQKHCKREGASIPCGFRDFLTDLRHLADAYELDFGERDHQAHQEYLEELVVDVQASEIDDKTE